MSTLTVELPDSLKNRIETLAAAEGSSDSQFMASAAGEKLAVVLTMDDLQREEALIVSPPTLRRGFNGFCASRIRPRI